MYKDEKWCDMVSEEFHIFEEYDDILSCKARYDQLLSERKSLLKILDGDNIESMRSYRGNVNAVDRDGDNFISRIRSMAMLREMAAKSFDFSFKQEVLYLTQEQWDNHPLIDAMMACGLRIKLKDLPFSLKKLSKSLQISERQIRILSSQADDIEDNIYLQIMNDLESRDELYAAMSSFIADVYDDIRGRNTEYVFLTQAKYPMVQMMLELDLSNIYPFTMLRGYKNIVAAYRKRLQDVIGITTEIDMQIALYEKEVIYLRDTLSFYQKFN